MPGRPTNEPSNYFALGKQSAKDTEATTFHFLKHLDGTALELDEAINSEREGGDGQEVGLRYKTGVSMDGNAIDNGRPESAARTLAWALGADSVSAPSAVAASGAAQIHTAVPTAAVPYLTAEQFYADQIERVTNAQITGVSIEMEQGRPIKITRNLIGGGTPYRRDAASAMTPVREAGQPYFYPGGSYVLNGAGNTKITKAKIGIARNVDGDIRTTELFREDVVALNFDVDFEATLKYEDKALYDRVHYAGGSMVPIDLATGSFQAFTGFGADTTARFFELVLPLFNFTAARVNKLDPDGKTMYLDVVGMGIKNATHQIFSRIQTASGGAF